MASALTPAPRQHARRAPAVQAALIQALALVPTIGLLKLAAYPQFVPPLVAAAVLQGVFAGLLTWVWGLDAWWRPIQLLFPAALLGADALHPPAPVLFGAFAFLLLLFWSTFRTQVPYYPSSRAVWRAVANVVPADRPFALIDIGSGLGGLVIDLAGRRPDSQLCGIELAPLPWLVSVVRARLTGSPARFVRGDYERLDFAGFDVIFAYLSPAAMPALWQKAVREMRPATMLISYEFNIAAKAPDKIVTPAGSGPPLYIWYF